MKPITSVFDLLYKINVEKDQRYIKLLIYCYSTNSVWLKKFQTTQPTLEQSLDWLERKIKFEKTYCNSCEYIVYHVNYKMNKYLMNE